MTDKQRFRLVKKCSYFIYDYDIGQTGTIIIGTTQWRPNSVIVDMDGYEEERNKNKEHYEEFGEPFNIVPYSCELPLNCLELLE